MSIGFGGKRFNFPAKLAAIAIKEVGLTVRVTEELKSVGVTKLAQLGNIDLDLLFPQGSAGGKQMELLIAAICDGSVEHSSAEHGKTAGGG